MLSVKWFFSCCCCYPTSARIPPGLLFACSIYTLTEIARRLARETGKYPEDVDIFRVFNADELLAKHASLVEQYKMDNQTLEKQVEELQADRVRLMRELRVNARQLGEDGLFYFGLTGDQMRLVNEFAENLRHGRVDLPEKDESSALRKQTEQLQTALAEERERFADAVVSLTKGQQPQQPPDREADEETTLARPTGGDEQLRALHEAIEALRRDNVALRELVAGGQKRLEGDVLAGAANDSSSTAQLEAVVRRAVRDATMASSTARHAAQHAGLPTAPVTEVPLPSNRQGALIGEGALTRVNATSSRKFARAVALLRRAEAEGRSGRIRAKDIPLLRHVIDALQRAQNFAVDAALSASSMAASASSAATKPRAPTSTHALMAQNALEALSLQRRTVVVNVDSVVSAFHTTTGQSPPPPQSPDRGTLQSAFAAQTAAGLVTPSARALWSQLRDRGFGGGKAEADGNSKSYALVATSSSSSTNSVDDLGASLGALLAALEALLLRSRESDGMATDLSASTALLQRVAAQIVMLYRSYITERATMARKLNDAVAYVVCIVARACFPFSPVLFVSFFGEGD